MMTGINKLDILYHNSVGKIVATADITIPITSTNMELALIIP